MNKTKKEIVNYMETLIEEKGKSVDSVICIDGHYGLTYAMLIEFIAAMPDTHRQIRNTLVKIDFLNGDVFHYFKHLARGMVASI